MTTIPGMYAAENCPAGNFIFSFLLEGTTQKIETIRSIARFWNPKKHVANQRELCWWLFFEPRSDNSAPKKNPVLWIDLEGLLDLLVLQQQILVGGFNPQVGMKIKHIWHHQLVAIDPSMFVPSRSGDFLSGIQHVNKLPPPAQSAQRKGVTGTVCKDRNVRTCIHHHLSIYLYIYNIELVYVRCRSPRLKIQNWIITRHLLRCHALHLFKHGYGKKQYKLHAKEFRKSHHIWWCIAKKWGFQ